MRGLKDKVFVVAGGGSGIGAGTALRLAEEGAAVVIGDLKADSAASVAARIHEAGGRAVGLDVDISDENSVQAFFAKAKEAFGTFHGAHINAADMYAIMEDKDALALDLAIFDRTIAVNIRGHLLCTRAALPELLTHGGGGLVYTSSGAAFAGEPERVSYAISKAGINALVRHVASRWGREGIRANAVAPGLVLTEGTARTMPQEAKDRLLAAGRSTRLGLPKDIAAMTALLLSDDGEWINGQVMLVDGGMVLY